MFNNSSSDKSITLRNAAILIGGIVLTDVFGHDALQALYTQHHAFLSYHLLESVLWVMGFFVSSFAFQIFAVVGVRQFLTKKSKPTSSFTTPKSNKTTILATSPVDGTVTAFELMPSDTKPSFLGTAGDAKTGGAGDVIFWAAMSTGIYLFGMDILLRYAQVPFPWLTHTDPTFPSLVRVLLEASASILAYDFIFYWIHKSFHATSSSPTKSESNLKPTIAGRMLRWWRSLHLTHHDHFQKADLPLCHMVTFHHHFLDAFLQVVVNIFVQQIPFLILFYPGSRHRVSKFVHNIFISYLLVEAHTGYDFFFMSHRLFPSIFGGSVRHQIHHQTGKHYFHQFFKYLDDWSNGSTTTTAATANPQQQHVSESTTLLSRSTEKNESSTAQHG